MNFSKLAIVVFSSLVFAGCGHVQTETKSQELPAIDEISQPQGELEGRVVQLNASDFTFGIEKIEVKAGEELTIMITNDSGFHDFVIDELDISTGIIKQGDSVKITIPTDKPGTYEYYCSVGNHRSLGMKGVLIIK